MPPLMIKVPENAGYGDVADKIKQGLKAQRFEGSEKLEIEEVSCLI